MFNDRQLHNGPFTCIAGFGIGYSFSKMLNGRPADNSFCTYFNSDEHTQLVDSLDKKTDVSGWQCRSGQINKEKLSHGFGKYWDDDGSIFIGHHKNGSITEGKDYEL